MHQPITIELDGGRTIRFRYPTVDDQLRYLEITQDTERGVRRLTELACEMIVESDGFDGDPPPLVVAQVAGEPFAAVVAGGGLEGNS